MIDNNSNIKLDIDKDMKKDKSVFRTCSLCVDKPHDD